MTALTPSADLLRTHCRPDGKLLAGLDAAAHRLGGFRARLGCRHLREEAEAIDTRAYTVREHSTAALARLMSEARRASRTTVAGEAEAMALLVETAHRQTGLRAHVEQIMGALAMGRGFFVEMSTGEGKTLAIALAAASGALLAPALHVITANDYLAARDAEWLTPFYRACGLSVACVTGEMDESARMAGYASSITYTTAREVIADFLRDRLRLGPLAPGARRLVQTVTRAAGEIPLVMRGLHRAIIDEADHALIDEAVTPLIISREQKNAPLAEACRTAYELARPLRRGVDYEAEERYQSIALHPAALAAFEEAGAGLPGLWESEQRRIELLTQSLVAREFFLRHKHYLVEGGKIVLIDESTGRLMPQRTLRHGLHQAIEAKEGLKIGAPAEILARLSFQKFFRRYTRLAGITGTGREAAAECWHVYQLPYVRIPTHRPCIRVQWPDRVFRTTEEKWEAIVAEIKRLHATGRPLLIGTRSVLASRHLAALLEAESLTFSLLNAEHHREEAEIVARAGEDGRLTIATNIAGRGTDIRPGPGVAALGGLHVLATERHESGRVDRQLFGRTGRQGDPGSAQAFCSLEDDLPLRFAPSWVRTFAGRFPALGKKASAFVIRQSQAAAERSARAQRQAVLQSDHWLENSLGFAGE